MAERKVMARERTVPICCGCGKPMAWIKSAKEVWLRCETPNCPSYFIECDFPSFELKVRDKQARTENSFAFLDYMAKKK